MRRKLAAMQNREATSKSSNAIRYVFSRSVFWRNALIGLAVGCLLTAVNLLDVILDRPFSLRVAAKIFFNFTIPFVVSSAGAAWNRRRDD